MRDWINKFYRMYGNTINVFLYIIIIMLFMSIMQWFGGH